MGLFDKLKRKKTETVDYEYLNKLIDTVNAICEKIVFREINISQSNVSYMPTKKTSFVGYKEGYMDQMLRSQKGMKKSNKLHAATQDYLRFVENKDGELVQVEAYVKGKVDCLFQVYWEENTRYLFPFSERGGFYPTYSYVTRYKGNSVVEEYMVERNRIIHETYVYKSDNNVEYNYINYVSGGEYPVLERRKGVFKVETLTYEENYYENWTEQ